jgi:hypothetical protein
MSVTNSPSVETYKAYAEALNARDIDRTRTYLHDDLSTKAGNGMGAARLGRRTDRLRN